MKKLIKPYTNFINLLLKYKNIRFSYALLPYLRRPIKSSYKYIKTLKKTTKLFANDSDLLQKLMQCNYVNIEGLTNKNPYVTIQFNEKNIRLNIINYDNIKVVEEIFINLLYNFNVNEDIVVCDVGMNVGVASLFFASFSNVKRVYGFEPFTETFKLAEENFKLNNELASKIYCSNYGLGKEDVSLNVPLSENGFLGGTTSSFVYKYLPENRKTKTTIVKVKEVSKIIQQIKTGNPTQKILLKLDCEGAEYDIIDNLCTTGLIDEINYIFAEYHFQGKEALVQHLTKRNFFVLSTTNDYISSYGMIYAFKKNYHDRA